MKLDEGERQMMLMALAHLAVERPGWDDALNRLALKFGDAPERGRAAMYDGFRQLRRRCVPEVLGATPEAGLNCPCEFCRQLRGEPVATSEKPS